VPRWLSFFTVAYRVHEKQKRGDPGPVWETSSTSGRSSTKKFCHNTTTALFSGERCLNMAVPTGVGSVLPLRWKKQWEKRRAVVVVAAKLFKSRVTGATERSSSLHWFFAAKSFMYATRASTASSGIAL
jgi:hypothetical protein